MLLPYKRRLYVFFFFFSSRRRHTRFDCDWSSDVCSSDLARRMNGATEPGRSMPPANPHAATAPPYRVMESTLASVVEPTLSMPPAQRSLPSDLGVPASSARSMIYAAPSPWRYSDSCGRPVEATT